jgi:hypothetical protein
MRSTPSGSLERLQPELSTTNDELHLMRRAAWRQQGVFVVALADVENDIERQVLLNLATRLYGPCPGGGGA